MHTRIAVLIGLLLGCDEPPVESPAELVAPSTKEPPKPWADAMRRHRERMGEIPGVGLPKPEGAMRSHVGGVGVDAGGLPPKIEGPTERLHVPLPFNDCVKHFRSALQSAGGTLASSVEATMATWAVLDEGRLVVARVIETGPRTARVELFGLTFPVEAELSSAEPRAPQTYSAASTAPIEVAPGSVVSVAGHDISETEAGVTGEVEVGATVASKPAAVRAHFESWLARERYETRKVVTKGGVIAVLGLRPDRMVFVTIVGRNTSAYAALYSGPVKRPAGMPRRGDVEFDDDDDAAIERRLRERGPQVQIQPGFTVGKPLPEGFPLMLIGGSNVEKAERTEVKDDRIRYLVSAQIAFGLETSMGPVEIDPYQHYKEQLQELGLRVIRRGKKLVGTGKKGECTITPGAKHRVVIDCTLAR